MTKIELLNEEMDRLHELLYETTDKQTRQWIMDSLDYMHEELVRVKEGGE
jgi:hypothetical protein